MSLEQKLQEDMKNALKSGQKLELATLRTVLAQIKDERIRLRPQRELTDDDVIRVLTSAVKKRREAIDLYKQGNRQDLVDKESGEITIIEKYLPEQLSVDKIKQVIEDTINKLGASSIQDLGKIMGPVMGQLKGRADGKTVQNMVRDRLLQKTP
ncbi:MAG: GatB/YqeY domain-containing protein [Calditrichaceae bacterium]|nr:GatB/YqeY domain-containing protein [Calditrichaceae bacterium]MBN2707562.1 GatB/YqeY domain-containing protein [Calditrichaceae bacterium]RQV95647.1 MAG: GatB/YqeY domain-containing protein [Calditrichota bacterium]